MQTDRLFEIVYCLLGGKSVTAGELAERFGVSKRTIYRDIDVLSVSGIPVRTRNGNGGGISILDDFVLNKSVLNERDQNEILSALQGLSTVKTDETVQVLRKLSSFFSRSAPNWFEVDYASWGHGGGGHLFPLIKAAIFEKRLAEFDYYNSYGEKRHRRVEPIQLWFKSRSWYLRGFCLTKQDLRLYKLTRIKNLVVTEDHFFERDLTEKQTAQAQNDPAESRARDVTLVLKIAPEMTYRVYDDYEEEQISKNDDGSFTATMTEPEDNWLYGYILSYGEYAEVLEPARIRNIIQEKLKTMTGNYS